MKLHTSNPKKSVLTIETSVQEPMENTYFHAPRWKTVRKGINWFEIITEKSSSAISS